MADLFTAAVGYGHVWLFDGHINQGVAISTIQLGQFHRQCPLYTPLYILWLIVVYLLILLTKQFQGTGSREQVYDAYIYILLSCLFHVSRRTFLTNGSNFFLHSHFFFLNYHF